MVNAYFFQTLKQNEQSIYYRFPSSFFPKVREVMEAVTDNGRMDTELIIGGTTLLTPDDMFDLMLN
jgi:hypothetical protein